jgi:hypothetical protein
MTGSFFCGGNNCGYGDRLRDDKGAEVLYVSDAILENAMIDATTKLLGLDQRSNNLSLLPFIQRTFR